MFDKVGSPLPSLTKRSKTSARKTFDGGKIERGWLALPSKRDRLEKFARRSKSAMGSLPERIVWHWLEYRKYQFATQYVLISAGARLDFLVYLGAAPGVAIRVQGSYWHSLPERVHSDIAQYLRLIAKGYRVVDFDELEIYEAVLAGNFYTWADKKLFEVA